MMAEMTFGAWLQQERKRLRLTQAQLAGQIGCSTITLRKIEAEQRHPSSSILDRLADIFAIPPFDRAAFQRFAHGDWQAAPASILTGPIWRVERAPQSRLPAPLTSFIGRERDVAKVQEYLAEPTTRLVTLIGPPGIGKTRLSLHVASEVQGNFADGVFFVSLAPVTDLNLVAPAIVQALGLVLTDQRSAFERLKDGINNRSLLIVLDNFEQIVEAAPLAPELLAACPRLKIIVTSRESLRVPGEWLYPLLPLSTPDERQVKRLAADTLEQFSALRLFAERARAVQPDFTLTPENAPTVATICRQLDGLPLAIELIAARIRLMSPQSLLAQLTSDFTLRADGMRGVPLRQKTLYNAIAWSYDLLSRDEQVLLARLSVFAGGFTLDAAQAVTRTPNVTAGLTSLLDRSLLVKTSDVNGDARFSLLVMIHDFALDRLRKQNEESTLRDRHAAYFLDLAERADWQMHGPQQVEWLNRLDGDQVNCRAAMEWCVSNQKTEEALRLIGALSWTWFMRGYWGDILEKFDEVRALPDLDDYAFAYVKALNGMARIATTIGAHRVARVFLEDSRDIGMALGVKGEFGLAESLNLLDQVLRWGEGPRRSRSLAQQSVALYRKSGSLWGLAEGLYNLALHAMLRNDAAQAFSLHEQCLGLFRQLGDLWGMGRVSERLAFLFLDKADYLKASSMYTHALEIYQEVTYKQGIAHCLAGLGDVCRHEGDNDKALAYYQASLAIGQECGLMRDIAYALNGLGLIALHRHEYARATGHYRESATLFAKSGQRESVAGCVFGLAAVAAGSNQPDHAARLMGVAQTMDISANEVLWPIDLDVLNRHIRLAREQLGEECFEVLQAEGRAMSPEEAIKFALSNQTEFGFAANATSSP